MEHNHELYSIALDELPAKSHMSHFEWPNPIECLDELSSSDFTYLIRITESNPGTLQKIMEDKNRFLFKVFFFLIEV